MARQLKAFISYSHADEKALIRFQKHISVLLREGTLSKWVDQKILAGDAIDPVISKELEDCGLYLALVSPDFLASHYCYDQEMKRALDRAERGLTRIVPIIVQPCDWHSSPLRNYKALPKDGKPVSEWANENNAWLDVVNEIRRVVKESTAFEVGRSLSNDLNTIAATQKYRVKRTFDNIDKQEYRERAFAEIKSYFETASNEINSLDGVKSKLSPIDNDGFTCTVVNQARQRGTAHISVYQKRGRFAFGDIYYSFSEHAERNTANGWLWIEGDDYELQLRWDSMRGMGRPERMSAAAAARCIWVDFVRQAGIDCE